MSLLLLFPSGSGFQWTIIDGTTTDWLNSHYDFKNIWGEWETYTWGALSSSGVTWAAMAGFTFANSSTAPSTTWTNIST